MVSPPSEPHSEKAHPNSPPQINLAFKAKGPDQDPGTTQPEGNSTHLKFFPRGGARVPGAPLDPPMQPFFRSNPKEKVAKSWITFSLYPLLSHY